MTACLVEEMRQVQEPNDEFVVARTRRGFLQAFGNTAALTALIATGLLKPTRVLAVNFDRAAFEATKTSDALRLIGAADTAFSSDIVVKAPEVAENGAAVPIEVVSRIPGTIRLSVIVERNPFPLALQFNFAAGASPRFQARLKMAETSRLRIIAFADDRHYTVLREVKLTVGGCGAE